MAKTKKTTGAGKAPKAPKVGTKLYLHQKTGNIMIDMVKRPYTVCEVNSPQCITVRRAKLIYPIFRYDPSIMSEYYAQFDGKRVAFYDTVAEGFEDDPNGDTMILRWSRKHKAWAHSEYSGDRYPELAVLGNWEHQPYLD